MGFRILVHCCNSSVDTCTSYNRKKCLIYFLSCIVHCISTIKNDNSNAFKRSIFSDFSPRNFSVDSKITLIFLTNQNKCYVITLINRWMNTLWRYYYLLYLLIQNLTCLKHATSYRKRLFFWRMFVQNVKCRSAA